MKLQEFLNTKITSTDKINEAEEVELWDVVDEDLTSLEEQLESLLNDTTDPKWKSALKGFIKDVEKLRRVMFAKSEQLGMIPMNESFLETSESLNEKMTFADVKKEYLENPYGIGANTIEDEGNRLTLRFSGSYERQEALKKLRGMGIMAKKMNTYTEPKAFKYPYELIIFENENL